MFTNSDATFYLNGEEGYSRLYVPHVFWQEKEENEASKQGVTGENTVYIAIPNDEISQAAFQPKKDMVVKGNCGIIFDNSSDKGVSDSLKKLKKYSRVYEVLSASAKLYGSRNMHHYELNCR